jgi:hypothetical protein
MADFVKGGDPRDKKLEERDSEFLNKIDFKWVETTVDKKKLKKAYNVLKEDGGFPQLF